MIADARYGKGLGAPIIFSVTGHRDIRAEREDAENKIAELFIEFQKKYPDTELILMTGLAEGGDRIAARAAMRSGVMVAPVLPSTVENYKKTFGFGDDAAAAAEEFDDILNDNERTYSPCILSNADLTAPDANEAYRDLATYLIANSHVIIALWDGLEYTGKKTEGGTYDTLRTAYRGVEHTCRDMAQPVPDLEGKKKLSPDRLLDITEDCLIHVMKVSRGLSDEEIIKRGGLFSVPRMPQGTCGYIVPQMVADDVESFEGSDETQEQSARIDGNDVKMYDSLPLYYHHIFSKIDVMNKDIEDQAGRNADGAGKKKRTREQRMGDMFGDRAKELNDKGIMGEMISRMMIVDDLAGTYQSLSFKNIKISIVMAAVTAMMLQLYILIGGDLLLIALYIASLGAGMLFYYAYMKKGYFLKFIEYRLIAESMRVSCYWSILGINESVTSSCYGYMKNDMSWVRCVITAWESFFLNDHSKTENMEKGTRRAIGTEWIEGQKKYHKGKIKKNEKKSSKIKKYWYVTRYALLVLSVIVFLFTLLLDGTVFYTTEDIISPILDLVLVSSFEITDLLILQLAMMLLSAAMIIIIGVEDKLIHGGTSGQIEAKFRMFDIASKRLEIMENNVTKDEIGDVRRGVYYELGSQCITEVNDWAFEHLAKDMDSPSGSDLQSKTKVR
jgi:hypothetical protein